MPRAAAEQQTEAFAFARAPVLSLTKWRIAHDDCVRWLRTLPAESIDCVVTDPAYESLEKHRAIGTTTRLTGDWFEIFRNERFPALFEELYRVLKDDTHFYFFCDQETMFVAKPMAEAAGFKFWKPLIFDKQAIGMGYHYRARYELILFFEKGKRKLNDLSIPDVLTFKRIHGGYPTEKPAPLSRVLIEQSTKPGEVVIDPFMGSASVGEAALLAGRRFFGCDLAEKAITRARSRLEPLGGTEG